MAMEAATEAVTMEQGLTPYNIQVGHPHVKSQVNLKRPMTWLRTLSPREAQRVMWALPITHHAGDEHKRGKSRSELPENRAGLSMT